MNKISSYQKLKKEIERLKKENEEMGSKNYHYMVAIHDAKSRVEFRGSMVRAGVGLCGNEETPMARTFEELKTLILELPEPGDKRLRRDNHYLNQCLKEQEDVIVYLYKELKKERGCFVMPLFCSCGDYITHVQQPDYLTDLISEHDV